jgi:putative hydrolase of the HAD superfamily
VPVQHHTAVIFDYGNVLAQTLDHRPRARWEQRCGLPPGALERLVHNTHSWVAAQCGRISAEAHWHAVATRLKLSREEAVALQATFYSGDMLNTAVLTRLDALRAARIPTALLSNFSTDLRRLLRQQDLLRRFDHVGISAEIGVMKPDAAAYQAVLARLALPATACIFVDDQPDNVMAARVLGMQGVVFDNTPACLAALDDLLAPLLAAARMIPP